MKKSISRIALAAVCLWVLQGSAAARELLIPGGQVIGLQLCNDTVTVADFDDTLGSDSKAAGLQVGDAILSIDGRCVKSARDVCDALDRSDGSVEVKVSRGGKEKKLKLRPKITDHGPRLGVYLRDGVTGIGTVTWYDPETGKFGTLGHESTPLPSCTDPIHTLYDCVFLKKISPPHGPYKIQQIQQLKQNHDREDSGSTLSHPAEASHTRSYIIPAHLSHTSGRHPYTQSIRRQP